MSAISVEPKKPGTARLAQIPEPDAREGSVLVEAVAVGVCGTDIEIVEGKYGWAPPGRTELVLGHESLGRVIYPGPAGALEKGDLVAGIVRRPDPVPCPSQNQTLKQSSLRNRSPHPAPPRSLNLAAA